VLDEILLVLGPTKGLVVNVDGQALEVVDVVPQANVRDARADDLDVHDEKERG